MAARGSPAWRVPGSPLAGIVRDLSRRTRSVERQYSRARPGPPGPVGEPGPHGPVGPPGRPAVAAAAVVATGCDGRAVWRFDVPFTAPPVVTATPAHLGGDHVAVGAAIEEVTCEQVTVRVRLLQALASSDLVVRPAGEGVAVHLTAADAEHAISADEPT